MKKFSSSSSSIRITLLNTSKFLKFVEREREREREKLLFFYFFKKVT